MRPLLVVLHRWFGLFVAVFLLVSGLTGAIISWDHELDAWLNPQFYHADRDGKAAQSTLAIANQLEAQRPEVIVTYLPLSLAPDEALNLFVESHPTQTKELPYNQLAINPVSAEAQGQRLWGEVSLSRENLLPFLYKLHYSMHIPDGWGVELGVLFMGIVGIVWALDCFVALWISFPAWKQWRKSLAFRWSAGGYKLNFDLHRSGGVWLWLLLLIVAVTSVSMNLGFQVMRPLVNQISPLTPSPFETLATTEPVVPVIKREQIVAQAKQDAAEKQIDAAIGAIFYNKLYNVYGVGFFEPGKSHGDGGLGNPWLYYNAKNGEFVGADIPGTGSAGDVFMQLQFPLHSGRIAGVTGRIVMSIMGLVVAGLSVTGIVIWMRKRRSRIAVKQMNERADVMLNAAS